MLCGDTDLTIDEGLSKKVFTNHGHATRTVTDFIEQRLVSQVK
jgi:hypothetical protein